MADCCDLSFSKWHIFHFAPRSSNWERQELTTAQVTWTFLVMFFLGFAKSKVKVEYAAMDVWVALRLYQQSFGCTRGWFHALLLILATLENHFGAKFYFFWIFTEKAGKLWDFLVTLRHVAMTQASSSLWRHLALQIDIFAVIFGAKWTTTSRFVFQKWWISDTLQNLHLSLKIFIHHVFPLAGLKPVSSCLIALHDLFPAPEKKRKTLQSLLDFLEPERNYGLLPWLKP